MYVIPLLEPCSLDRRIRVNLFSFDDGHLLEVVLQSISPGLSGRIRDLPLRTLAMQSPVIEPPTMTARPGIRSCVLRGTPACCMSARAVKCTSMYCLNRCQASAAKGITSNDIYSIMLVWKEECDKGRRRVEHALGLFAW